jgi:hypothetical protein
VRSRSSSRSPSPRHRLPAAPKPPAPRCLHGARARSPWTCAGACTRRSRPRMSSRPRRARCARRQLSRAPSATCARTACWIRRLSRPPRPPRPRQPPPQTLQVQLHPSRIRPTRALPAPPRTPPRKSTAHVLASADEASPSPFPEPAPTREAYSAHIYGSVRIADVPPVPRAAAGSAAGAPAAVTMLTARKKQTRAGA